MTTPFWINNPSILINRDNVLQFWPTEKMTFNEKLNSISRIVIFLTIIGTCIIQSFKMFFTGIVTILAIILLYYFENNKNSKKESFSTIEDIKKDFCIPKKTNPLCNVQLTQYTENPNRKSAAPAFNPIVKEEINERTQSFIASQFSEVPEKQEDIKKRLFRDLGDNFTFAQSMRNFYSTPSTTIPNDQKSFAEFCYGDMPSCKEGDPLACSQWNPRWINGQE